MVSLFGVGDFDPVIPSNVGLRSRQKTEESWCRWKGLEGTVDQSKGGGGLENQRAAWRAFKDTLALGQSSVP